MKAPFSARDFALIAGLAVGLISARAESKLSIEVLYDITLDIDNDRKMDRAVLVKDPGSEYTDLYIYLGSGAEKLDLSRKPTFVKKDLTTERILALESKSNGSLVVIYGCGGCSNDYKTTLTVVHRRGEFLTVASPSTGTRGMTLAVATSTFSRGKGPGREGKRTASDSKQNSSS
jgi:hypothetical protein